MFKLISMIQPTINRQGRFNLIEHNYKFLPFHTRWRNRICNSCVNIFSCWKMAEWTKKLRIITVLRRFSGWRFSPKKTIRISEWNELEKHCYHSSPKWNTVLELNTMPTHVKWWLQAEVKLKSSAQKTSFKMRSS